MPGKLIETYQVRVYMNARELGLSQAEAAYVAEFSERSGQRIEAVIAKLNAKCQQKFELERGTFQSLPQLYHDRIVGFVGTTEVVKLPRIHVHGSAAIRRARCINYRHVVESLRRKPRAFLYCQWQADLLPDSDWRELWQQMKRGADPDTAARWMVEALYIAATQDREVEVANYLKTELVTGTFTLHRLQHQFNLMQTLSIPEVASVQHELSSYDQLFQQSPALTESVSEPDERAQTAQTGPLPVRLASGRTSSHPGELELRSISVGTGRRGSPSARPGSHCPHTVRSAIALRKILV
jgi:hypothetical protein